MVGKARKQVHQAGLVERETAWSYFIHTQEEEEKEQEARPICQTSLLSIS